MDSSQFHLWTGAFLRKHQPCYMVSATEGPHQSSKSSEDHDKNYAEQDEKKVFKRNRSRRIRD